MDRYDPIDLERALVRVRETRLALAPLLTDWDRIVLARYEDSLEQDEPRVNDIGRAYRALSRAVARSVGHPPHPRVAKRLSLI